MRRGEVWVLRGSGLAAKPRPVVVLQDDSAVFDTTVVCLLSSSDTTGAMTRVALSPTQENGLLRSCYAMTDKLYSAWSDEFGRCIGALSDDDMTRIGEQVKIVLGL